MGKNGHSEEKILRVLREVESGNTGGDLRKNGISRQTFYLWKKKYIGLELLWRLRGFCRIISHFGKLEIFSSLISLTATTAAPKWV